MKYWYLFLIILFVSCKSGNQNTGNQNNQVNRIRDVKNHINKEDIAETKIYIQRNTFTKVVSISPIAHHGDGILTVNTFYDMGKKIPWGEASTIVTYRYLGVDNQHNLYLEKKESHDLVDLNIRSELVFSLNSNNSGIITLIGQSAQKKPLHLLLKIDANNNRIITKYLGNLPEYEK